ncbi:MAG: Methyltransferase type 11 [Caulobacter sp.]|nr:Methyltransferase type 11 [Caulobacter sp.]
MSQALHDSQYYDAAAPNSLSERVMIAARDRIYADFLRLCRPTATDRILDVGVSDVVGDGANMLERKYPHPQNITAVGLGAGQDFRAAFPQVAYQRIAPGEPLPFADLSFDIVTSNAVIEHVGGPERQAAFVAELARVARQVFISAPNRWFPVEHHTAIPLLHYTRPTFAIACKALGKTSWLEEDELVLVGPKDLRALAPAGRAARVSYSGLPLGPFSSNLYLHLAPAG